jgi:hypothetical protein
MLKIQNMFYILGFIFLFAALSYFSYEYIFKLSPAFKTAILICLSVIAFFVADYMMEKDI